MILGAVAALIIGGGTTAIVWAATGQGASAAPITRTVAASLETMEKSVEATGTLTPAVQEDVSFAASGTVTSVRVEAGDTVKKGQTLATVDSLQANADLLQARSDRADARAQLAAVQDAADGTAASDARLAAAESAVEVADQAVADAKEARAGVRLTAPVSGIVTAVGVEVGDAVTGSGSSNSSASGASGSPQGTGASAAGGSSSSSSSSSSSTAQFTIVGTDEWSVAVSLGETEIGRIAVDDQVELATDDGTKLFGTVGEIGKLPSTSSGTAAFPVTIDLTGDTEGLYDGTSVTATIIYERRSDVLTVPSMAVTTADDGTSTVTMVGSDGKESTRTVTVGETSGTLTEITKGLSEGDKVLVTVFTPGASGSGSGGAGSGSGGRGQFPGGELPDFGDGQMPDFGNGQMPSLPGGGQ